MNFVRSLASRVAPLLGLVLLLSLALPPLWRMDCTITGRSSVEWITSTPCMGVEESPSEGCSLGNSCCEFSHVAADHAPTLTKVRQAVPAVRHCIVLTATAPRAPRPVFAALFVGPVLHAPPPERTGERLALKRSYLL